jgi:hypothetical protein
MNVKVGRNDYCPCGSGRKFKKCCGVEEIPGYVRALMKEPEGSRLELFMEVIGSLEKFMDTLQDSDPEGGKIKAEEELLYKKTRFGEKDGIPSSLALGFMLFDLAIGEGNPWTVASRFIDGPYFEKLPDIAQRAALALALSYSTFYRVDKIDGDTLTLFEIATGKNWTASVEGAFKLEESERGTVWFVRLAGKEDDAVVVCEPVPLDSFNDEQLKGEIAEVERFAKREFLGDENAEVSFAFLSHLVAPHWMMELAELVKEAAEAEGELDSREDTGRTRQ